MYLFTPLSLSRFMLFPSFSLLSFFFNDTATTEIYTLSLHDALPICACAARRSSTSPVWSSISLVMTARVVPSICRSLIHSNCRDRKSTRLNSSHRCISYAVFCLKKKKKQHEKENV